MKKPLTTSPSKDHAFIQWSEGWRGGSCCIDCDEKGAFVVTMLGSRIS